MVVWVIGISGSGKSFFAKKILNKIKGKKIHVDGDEVRKYLTYKLGYIKSDRKKNALLISDLCNLLEKKGFIVVCSILSIFKEHQKRNRKIFNKYMQIYLKANIKKVIEKNNKNIYSKKDVVGKQIKFGTVGPRGKKTGHGRAGPIFFAREPQGPKFHSPGPLGP